MPKSLTIRQTELDNWVMSKLDVEEYAWLLEAAGTVDNFLCFFDDLVNRISKGYESTEKEFAVCTKLGLIKVKKKATL
jgi:hypothetical protein